MMIEALESRQLLSVPSIAGAWSGVVFEIIGGGPEKKGKISINFAQSGTRISCAEADTYSPSLTYCRGTIDGKGRLRLNWSDHRNMRPVGGVGVGRIIRGKINLVISGKTSDGLPVAVAFRIHRG